MRIESDECVYVYVYVQTHSWQFDVNQELNHDSAQWPNNYGLSDTMNYIHKDKIANDDDFTVQSTHTMYMSTVYCVRMVWCYCP